MKKFVKKSMEELERLSISQYKESSKLPVYIILDNIRSMHNVGSVFRSADSFKIKKIYLCGLTPCPPHRDIHKTALGATESVDWQYVQNIEQVIVDLKSNGVSICAIEQTHESTALHLMSWQLNKDIAFVLGNEVAGVSDKALSLCDYSIEIPQLGSKHSLNISVAAGIVMWEYAKNFL